MALFRSASVANNVVHSRLLNAHSHSVVGYTAQGV